MKIANVLVAGWFFVVSQSADGCGGRHYKQIGPFKNEVQCKMVREQMGWRSKTECWDSTNQ